MREPTRSRFLALPRDAIATITFSGMTGRSSPSRVAVFLRLAGLIGGELAQCELAQRRQVAFAEEVRERLLDLGGIVDLALPQSGAERLDRDVHVDDLVGALEDPVGNRLPHPDAGGRRDRVVQRLDVLDVDRGNDVDAGVEQLENVLDTASRGADPGALVWASSSTTTTCGRRALMAATSISLSVTPRYSIARSGTCSRSPISAEGVGAAVRLDEADDDVEPLTLQLVGVLEHLVGLADTRRGADVHAQPRAPFLLGARQERLGGRRCRIGHSARYFFIGCCASSARFSSRTLTTGSPRKPNWRPSECSRPRADEPPTQDPSLARDARRLKVGGRRRDVRIQSGCGRGHEIDRHRHAGFSGLGCVDGGLHRVDQLLVRRPEIRAAGIRRVVSRPGGRRPRPEIAGRREAPGR